MKIKNFKITWHLWLFPLLALAFSGWFLKKYFDEKGKKIYVSFTDAQSIQAEKTKIFYRGVQVGIVDKVTISKDASKAICHISLQKAAVQFAVEGTEFYLVSPKVGFEGISGLETLISGSYIAIEPGNSKHKVKYRFKGKLSKQAIDPEEVTTNYLLETTHAESITTGDNVFYRGIVIGAVGDIRLSKTAQSVLIDINIRRRYTKLIRTNTSFWKKQGIKADLGLFKSDIKINSLDTIMKGGLEIATPTKAGDIAKYGHKFLLLKSEPEDRDEEKDWQPVLTYPSQKSKPGIKVKK